MGKKRSKADFLKKMPGGNNIKLNFVKNKTGTVVG
jgi:hypothetical protein